MGKQLEDAFRQAIGEHSRAAPRIEDDVTGADVEPAIGLPELGLVPEALGRPDARVGDRQKV